MATLRLVAACSLISAAFATTYRSFGTGLSQGWLSSTETVLFNYTLSSTGKWGSMTHFWSTGGPDVDYATFRYYVDGEAVASIQFSPPMACGTGFDDTTAPWGTEWLGKGATVGGWFHNYRIPFYENIVVTFQSGAGFPGTEIYTIVRGAENYDIHIGDFKLPFGSHMILQTQNVTLQPLDFYPSVNMVTGSGMIFMTTLAVSTGSWNFLEGCYHLYTPYGAAFPGTLLSTGTEDYYDSAYYFNAGQFRLPVSGYTHIATAGNNITWSAYRFHVKDPLFFNDGVQLVWRNGDVTDPVTGYKCTLNQGGEMIGQPTVSQVQSYAWVYVFPEA